MDIRTACCWLHLVQVGCSTWELADVMPKIAQSDLPHLFQGERGWDRYAQWYPCTIHNLLNLSRLLEYPAADQGQNDSTKLEMCLNHYPSVEWHFAAMY